MEANQNTNQDILNERSVYAININRGKDGVLTCAFRSPAVSRLCQALSGGKTTTITLDDVTHTVWDCRDDLLSIAQEEGLEEADRLLNYTDGRVKGLSLIPLCSTSLGEGITITPTFPHSATSLDAYAKALRGLVRTVFAAMAPVEISVKLVTKGK